MPLRWSTVVFLIICASAFPADWAVLDPSDLEAKTPKVQRDADAEALFWEVRLTDELDGGTLRAVLSHYLRVKIYTDRGREKLGTIDLPYLSSDKISDIAGRTIKPNGDIVELKKDAVYERDVVKARGLKLRTKSFALPAVEPGAIIEYRWREIRRDQLSNFIKIQFQREIPVQRVTYYIKPFSNPMFPFGMRSMAYQVVTRPFQKERDGFYSLTLNNQPAFIEEPDMPAEDRVRAWMMLYYAPEEQTPPNKYWPGMSASLFDSYKGRVKANNEIRQAATAAAGNESSPEAKLRKLYEFVKREIKNTDFDRSLTREARQALKENDNAAQTFKQKAGTSIDIALLYIALANAQGLDVRLARTGWNSDPLFRREFTNTYYLRSFVLTAKVGPGWIFFDPASPDLPFGMLSSFEEGTPALVADEKGLDLMGCPVSEPYQTTTTRTAQFKLDGEGGLEGEVKISYTGHENIWRKRGYSGKSQAELEEWVKEGVQRRWVNSDISNLQIKNMDDPLQPLTISYHIKIENFAERTGKRMFLRPAFFHTNYKPRFTDSERRGPVEFTNAWQDIDRVRIDLPIGFSLDNATSPESFSLGPVGGYKVSLRYDRAQSILFYERDLTFGSSGALHFPQSVYGQLKRAFEAIQQQDDHAVSLKQDSLRAN